MSLHIKKLDNSEMVLLNVTEDFSIPELGLIYKLNERDIVNTESENSHLAVINRPEVCELYDFSKTIIEKIEQNEDFKNIHTDENVWVNIHWNNHNNNSNFKPNNTITYGFKPE